MCQSHTGQLALGLVRELLEGLGLRHTLAVFLPEANLLKPSQQQQQQQAEQPEGVRPWVGDQGVVVENVK